MSKKTFTKKDIVREMKQISGENQKMLKPLVDTFFTALRHLLMKNVKEDIVRIEVRDFGAFEVKPTKSKSKARNPKTNEIVFVPAHKKTHFVPGKILKKYLSQPLENK
ncbi:MAG: HU family DNA-binding protein [Candidatus Marinimicrobia bacterium]|nr:HU family DNA-binding protein [Candidatus Neomarinimicrobiota bacterium]